MALPDITMKIVKTKIDLRIESEGQMSPKFEYFHDLPWYTFLLSYINF